MAKKKTEETFFSFLNGAVTPYHCTSEIGASLALAGFHVVSLTSPWKLAPGAYMAQGPGGSCFAWVIGKDAKAGDSVSLALAHTDFVAVSDSGVDMKIANIKRIFNNSFRVPC